MTFGGLGKREPGAKPLSYSAERVAGPSVTLQRAANLSPTFKASEVGPTGAELVLQPQAADRPRAVAW